MKPYILTTPNKFKLLITEEERNTVLHAINKGDKGVLIRDNLISLAIVPQITPFTQWYQQENDRLANSGKRLCKKCLGIMDAVNGCKCWKVKSTGENKNPLGLPPEVTKRLALLAENKRMPDAEKFEIEFEQSQIEYAEDGGMLGYKDPETGETMYS